MSPGYGDCSAIRMALTPDQAQELRRLIDQRTQALAAEVQQDVAKVREDTQEEIAGAVADAGDESVASLISDLDRAEAQRDAGELRSLEAASSRLADGSYGICGECGADIGFGRLRANPAAIRCIRCQEQFEKTHAVPGRTSL
jgi:DnaK suppressor protein